MSAALLTRPTSPVSPPTGFIREDQAAKLLRALSAGRSRGGLFRADNEPEPTPAPRPEVAVAAATHPTLKRPPLIAVASGKGGVGKTFFSVNLALEWRRLGRHAALIDLDWGLGNLDVALGIAPRRHLGTVLSGGCTLGEALVDYDGLMLLPNACGERFHPDALVGSLDALMGGLAGERPDCDLLVADTHPGLGPATVEVIRRAAATVLISTPEPTAITDTYALLKVLSQTSRAGTVGLVINQAPSVERAQEAAERLGAVARRFLDWEVPYWGCVLQDAAVSQSVCRQRPLMLDATAGRTTIALRQVAARAMDVVTGATA